MSNINLYQSYLNKVRKFGVNDSLRFRASYVEAVNLVYAEINDLVFQNQTLPYIDYFNDVIDTRLKTFTNMTFEDSDLAIGEREYWSAEYWLEKTSATNGFIDTIADDSTNVVISIANSVVSIVGDTLSATGTIPATVTDIALKFVTDATGNALFLNGDVVPLTYTLGDGDSTQKIGIVDTHVINGVSGYEIERTRFLTEGTVVYDFAFKKETVETNLTDEVAGYIGTLVGQQWDTRWIEPSSGLDSQYRASFDMGIDYHLQDGGEWAIEAEGERERKWYTRGIKNARNVFQNNTTYISPLNIQE